MIIKKIDKKIFSLLCIVIIYMFISNMTGVYYKYLPFHDFLLFAIMIIAILGIINQMLIKKQKLTSTIIILFFLLVLIFVSSFIFLSKLNISYTYLLRQIISAILWILIMLYTYLVSGHNEEIIKVIKKLPYVLPIFLIAYMGIKSFSNNAGIALISSVYYLMFLLPILLLNKNKIIKIVGLIIIFYALLLSQKRTGLVSITVFLVFYYIFNANLKDKHWKDILKSTFIFLISLLLIIFVTYMAAKKYNIELLNKMIRISEDGGSGRTEIWSLIISSFKECSILNLIFGHGFNSVYYNFSFQLSAHNDYLEILYDYGIIGIVLYLLLIRILLKKGFKLLKEKNEIAPSFLASIFFAIAFSLTSHLVIYPTYYLFFCIFWGYCLSINTEKKE